MSSTRLVLQQRPLMNVCNAGPTAFFILICFYQYLTQLNKLSPAPTHYTHATMAPKTVKSAPSHPSYVYVHCKSTAHRARLRPA